MSNNISVTNYTYIPNPFGKLQKKGNLICLPFSCSTMLYDKEKKMLYVSGNNFFGELGIGNVNSLNTF